MSEQIAKVDLNMLAREEATKGAFSLQAHTPVEMYVYHQEEDGMPERITTLGLVTLPETTEARISRRLANPPMQDAVVELTPMNEELKNIDRMPSDTQDQMQDRSDLRNVEEKLLANEIIKAMGERVAALLDEKNLTIADVRRLGFGVATI